MRLLFILLLLYTPILHAQKTPNFGKLKQPNEEVIVGFTLKSSNKIALLCKDKDDKYLVYRFGTKEKVDLVYPTILDNSSWKKFVYYGYYRGGGIENASMGDYTLTFSNKDVTYEIYENWSSEENFTVHLGINVTVNKKTTDLAGDVKHRWGTLDELRLLDDLIHNKWGD